MVRGRGRPVCLGVRHWRNDEAFASSVLSIAATRDSDDETSLTEVVYAVQALAKATIPAESLSENRLECLRRLVLRARPSRIVRTLVGWRDNLPDRILRRIQRREDLKNIAELWWA
jgi:hypothetical protein